MIDKLNNLNLSNNDLELNNIYKNEKLNNTNTGELISVLKDVQGNLNKEMVIRIKKMIEKAENIAIKIVKGESLTSEEKEFINKNYLQLKEFANKTYKESNELKAFIKMSKLGEIQNTEKDINDLINNEKVKNDTLFKDCKITKSEWKIKEESLNEVIKSSKQTTKNKEVELKNFEYIKDNILKGEKITLKELKFIQSKDPQIKRIVEETVKEVIDSSLKKENTNLKLDKKIDMLKLIEDTKEKGSKGLLSELEVKIKLLIFEDENDIYSKIVNPELIYTINPFVYFKTNLMSVSLIGLVIASVILVVSLLLR